MIFPGSSADKESACIAGDPGLIPGLARSPGEEIGYSLQYSWASLVAQTVKNPPAKWETWVWKIPRRREWLATPVFWPGELHGQRSLMGYSPRGLKQSDTTEQLPQMKKTVKYYCKPYIRCVLFIPPRSIIIIRAKPMNHPTDFPIKWCMEGSLTCGLTRERW